MPDIIIFLYIRGVMCSNDMKQVLFVVSSLFFACKAQEQSGLSSPQLRRVEEYLPNPDEVVLFLKLLESEKTEGGWNAKVQVQRQLKSGFGFKKRLNPGEEIMLYSQVEIQGEEFYCSVDYYPGMNHSETYILTSLLSK